MMAPRLTPYLSRLSTLVNGIQRRSVHGIAPLTSAVNTDWHKALTKSSWVTLLLVAHLLDSPLLLVAHLDSPLLLVAHLLDSPLLLVPHLDSPHLSSPAPDAMLLYSTTTDQTLLYKVLASLAN
ncbi:hypothetical protein Pcinc_021506 [Petrolisthes cinctipes]|uniref:Uncharacterized protein n=1 Tax=Petrolisthes cinctipes TaxID=88211 RepID=A0AAE1KEZ5_PETCI|nr:hypothetical protein Pcinc_021506 [Petrolisthes cinctipes]